jgi:hypothetical protein
MSLQPETRYVCDRCGHEAIVPMQNVPAHQREQGPEGWLVMRLSGTAGELSHLCEKCHELFKVFMRDRIVIR